MHCPPSLTPKSDAPRLLMNCPHPLLQGHGSTASAQSPTAAPTIGQPSFRCSGRPDTYPMPDPPLSGHPVWSSQHGHWCHLVVLSATLSVCWTKPHIISGGGGGGLTNALTHYPSPRAPSLGLDEKQFMQWFFGKCVEYSNLGVPGCHHPLAVPLKHQRKLTACGSGPRV